MLFFAIFATLLLIYFGLIDRWLKRRTVKIPKAIQPAFDILGGIIDLLRF